MPDVPNFDEWVKTQPKSAPRDDSALNLIAKYESGDQNVRNYRYDPTHTAQGHFQITNTNWRNYGPRAGVNLKQYPSAMAAPRETQAQVAGLMHKERGFKDWAPFNAKLRAALARGEQGVTQQVQSAPTEIPKFDDWQAGQSTPKQQSAPVPKFDDWVKGAQPKSQPKQTLATATGRGAAYARTALAKPSQTRGIARRQPRVVPANPAATELINSLPVPTNAPPKPRQEASMSARQPSTWERIKETVAPYVPGLSTLDTAFGVKTDPIRGAVSGATLGTLGDPREVSREELIVDPNAQAKADTAHAVGQFAPALIPYVAAEKALSYVPLLAQEGRLASIARTALTFGGVELSREAIRAAKTDTPLDPKEVAISTAIGAAMGTLSGVNPSLKRRIVAFVTPQAVADVARGTDPQQAVLSAFTNLGFALHAGGRAPRDLEARLKNAEQQSTNVPTEAVGGSETRVPPPTEPLAATEAQALVEPKRFFHRDFGEVTESPNQRRVGKGRVRVVTADGRQPVIKRPTGTGANNQRAVPIPTERAAETPTAVETPKPTETQAAPTMTRDQIISGISRTNTGQVDTAMLDQLLPQGEYELAEVPVRDLKAPYGTATPERVGEYAARETDAPPLVVNEKGEVVDGKHRLEAAQQRGDETVRVWRPKAAETVTEPQVAGEKEQQLNEAAAQQGAEVSPQTATTERVVPDLTDAELQEALRYPLSGRGVYAAEGIGETFRRMRKEIEAERAAAPKSEQVGASLPTEPDWQLGKPKTKLTPKEQEWLDWAESGARDVLGDENFVRDNPDAGTRAGQVEDMLYRLEDQAPDVAEGLGFSKQALNSLRRKLNAEGYFNVDESPSTEQVSPERRGATTPVSEGGGLPVSPPSELPLSERLKIALASANKATADRPQGAARTERPPTIEDKNALRDIGQRYDQSKLTDADVVNELERQGLLKNETEAYRKAQQEYREYGERMEGPDAVFEEQILPKLTEGGGVRPEPPPSLAESGTKSPTTAEPSVPDFVQRARDREAAHAKFESEGGEYRGSGGPDTQRIIDQLIIHGWDIYSKTKPKFDAWAKEMRDKFGAKVEPHLRRVYAGLAGEPSDTSARKAEMAQDRAELDLPELPPAERKSWQQSLNEAQPDTANRLADEVLTRPRALNDTETASLVVRAQQVKNEHVQLLKEIGETTDPELLGQKRAQLQSLESEFDKLTTAAKKSGTEKGRALAAQKLTINQDFDLISMKNRLKAAKGEELSAKENAKVEDLHARLAKAESERDAALERATQAELQQQVNRVARKRQRAETREALDVEFAQLSQQFSAKMRGIQPSGIDPTLIPVVAKMARNRVRAGVSDAAQLVDDIHAALVEHLPDLTKRDVRDAISGYGLETQGDRRSEAAKQLASIRTELRNLSKGEDVEAGARLGAKDAARRKQLLKQEAELQRRIAEKDFDPKDRPRPTYNRETYAREKQVKDLKAEYERLRYNATRGTVGKITDTGVGIGNVPKTLLSMGDLSALLRQGGVGVMQHPILSTRAAKDMLRSFTEHGFANVEQAIKASPEFENARRAGVEFTGVDRDNPRLNLHEEGYLGGNIIDVAAKGRYNPLKGVKAVKDFSERTFVSFLDSQRMRIFEQQSQALRDMGLKGRDLDNALKSQAKYINIITGRGSLGTQGNKAAPMMNLFMFSPRLVASRFQLLNKMANPVAWARMPKGARKLQMVDNIKFLVGAATVLGLAKMAGANVNLDPDDADFLKVRIGNTRYDTLAGLQQPMRFMWRMAKAIKGGETYTGDPKSKILKDFTRSKASPEVGYGWDFIEGQNRLSGKKFEAGKDLRGQLIPLPAQDFMETIKENGALKGTVEAIPSLLGVGVQTYKDAAEKPKTHAEKLARRLIMNKLPDEARDQEQIDTDQKKAEIRARSRRGEDVSAELKALGPKITERQAKSILAARSKTRLQEDFNRLGVKEALLVWSVASDAQRSELREIMERKANLIDLQPEEAQQALKDKLNTYGIQPAPKKKQSDAFSKFKNKFAPTTR